MNVANLQLEGLVMAIAAINQSLVAKGVLSVDDVDLSLRKVEASMTSEERLFQDMSPSNRDAVCFPIRLLRMANLSQGEDGVPSFAELARMVAKAKASYGDQR